MRTTIVISTVLFKIKTGNLKVYAWNVSSSKLFQNKTDLYKIVFYAAKKQIKHWFQVFKITYISIIPKLWRKIKSVSKHTFSKKKKVIIKYFFYLYIIIYQLFKLQPISIHK